MYNTRQLFSIIFDIPYMQSDTSAVAHMLPMTKSPWHHLTAVLGEDISHPTSLQGQIACAIAPTSVSGQEIVAEVDPDVGLKELVSAPQPSEIEGRLLSDQCNS